MMIFSLPVKFGTITDGDGSYAPGKNNCSWIVAPEGAHQIEVTFGKLQVQDLLSFSN